MQEMIQIIKMKHFLFLLVTTSLLLSCKSAPQEKIVKNDSGLISGKYLIDEKSGLKEGRFVNYYDNGQKSEEGLYKKDKLDGKRIIYRYDDESVEIVENYSNEKLEGDYTFFYPSSKIKQFGQYKDNEMVGEWLLYYENGQIKEKVTMQNNQENGPFIEYYESGVLKAEGNYKNGDNEDGELKMYNKKGELVKIMDCVERRCKTRWEQEN